MAEISFSYIKAEGIDGSCEKDVFDEIDRRNLELIQVKDVFMGYLKLREHQPILFDIKGDLNDIWKIQGAGRLIGSTVRTILTQGDDAISQMFDVKMDIRDRYALPREFDRESEMSYPNYMHAADNRAQVENDVRVLLPDNLELVQGVNGINPIRQSIW